MKGLEPLHEDEGAGKAAPSETVAEANRSFAKRWKHHELFARGFVAVPTLFLHHYAHLKPHALSTGEAMFVLHLMEFKWTEDAPFPGYATLAHRMGISDKMARRHAQSLEAKKYLRREFRKGQTNRFDLTPLFDALLRAVEEEKRKPTTIKTARKARKEYRDDMISWYARMVEAFTKMPEADRRALKEWEAENLGDKRLATSDWPEWEKYVGKKPDK
jgi:DNA-binding MarR family transcriptional regulator